MLNITSFFQNVTFCSHFPFSFYDSDRGKNHISSPLWKPSPMTSRASVTITNALGSVLVTSSFNRTICFFPTTQKSMVFSSPEYIPLAEIPVSPLSSSSIRLFASSSCRSVMMKAILANFIPSRNPSVTFVVTKIAITA